MEINIKVRNAKLSDAPRILEIYTYYVENTVITFDTMSLPLKIREPHDRYHEKISLSRHRT